MALTVSMIDDRTEEWTLTGTYACGHTADPTLRVSGFGMVRDAAALQTKYDAPKACPHCFHNWMVKAGELASCDDICRQNGEHPRYR